MLFAHIEENLNWNILKILHFWGSWSKMCPKLDTDLNPTQTVVKEPWATVDSFIQD